MQDAYAQALLKLVEKGETPHAAVQKLHETLKAHGRVALMPKIIRAFERLAQKQMEKTRVKLVVAHQHDAKRAQHEAEHALGTTHQHMSIDTDPSLIGGWRVESGEELVDSSYKQQLLTIFNRATAH